MNRIKITIASLLFMLSTTVAYAGGITIDSGPTLDLNTGTINVAGDMTIDGTLILGTGTLSLTGDWNKTGTFTSDTGIVILKGTAQADIIGANSFYNLTIDTFADGAKTIRFEAAQTQTITNNLVITGYAGKVLTIRSTSDGSAGIIDIPASIANNVDFVNVKDNAVNGVNTITAGSSSTGVSNTPNWIFNTGDGANIPSGKYICVTPNPGAVKDLAGNAVANVAVCTAVAVPSKPTDVSFTAVGGTVLGNTLNSTNTNFTASATITAGQATGGSAELLKDGSSFPTPILDSSIGGADTSVTFDPGFTTNGQVQAAFASGATLSVRVTDSLGNAVESSVANPTILIDYVAPTAPSGATIVAGSGWITDYITVNNVTDVKVSGTKSTDTISIQIEIDDEDTFTAAKTTTLSGLGATTTYADATGIDVTTPTALSDGNIAIRITATDAAGNTSTQTVLTGSSTFVKDLSVPAAPSVPDLDAADDTGSSSTDNITSQTSSLTFTGTAVAGSTIQLYDGASPVGTSTTATGGNWSIDLSLAAGSSYSINAIATSPVGSSSSASGSLVVTIDNSPPTAPSGATIVAGSGWITDYITSNNQTAVKVSGTKSTDTVSIQIEIDDEDTFTSAKTTTLSGLGAVTTYADATGIDVSTPTALSDGNIAIRITATDAAGNTSTQTVLTGSATFIKDVGTTPTPSVPDLDAADDTGSSSTDNITSQTTNLTFTGTAEVDSTVQLYDGASPVGTSTTATGGNWSIDLSLTAGSSYSINAIATDGVGNPSNPSGNLVVVVDNTAPVISGVSLDTGNYIIGNAINVTIDADETGYSAGAITINSETMSGFNDETDTTYTGTYTVIEGNTDRASVAAIPISIVLTDVAGNSNAAYTTAPTGAGGGVTIDANRPTLPTVTIASDNADPTLAQVGDTITVTIVSNENIQSPTATIAGNAASISGANTNWTATYTMQGSDASGVIPFTVDFSDAPGNTGVQVTSTTNASSVTFDKSGPVVTDLEITITSTPTGAGGIYIIGDTVTARWDNTVATGDGNTDISGATVDFTAFGGGAAVAMSNASEIYTASYVIVAGAIDASNLNVSVTATDNASNATTTADTSNLSLDNDVPALSTVTIASNNANSTLAKVGDIVTVTIISDEDIQSPTATIAGSAASISGSNSNWTASYTMQAGDTEGIIPFTVDFSDVPGNTGVQVTSTTNASSVTFDKTPPVISAVSIAAGTYKIGSAVGVTITANTAGYSAGTITINGEAMTAFSDVGDATYTGTYTVVEGNNDHTTVSTIGISVVLIDGAGNANSAYTSAPTSGGSVTIDAHKPTITSVTLTPSTGVLNVDDTVQITVTAGGNETGLTPSNATFNGQSVPLTGQGDGTYTGVYTVQNGHPDSTNPEATGITLTDPAGNISTAAASSGNTLVIDVNPATDFKITGSATQTAGDVNIITVTAYDGLGGVDLQYNGAKNLTFSGATASSGGNTPTVDAINFGTATSLTFTNGVATANMILYNAVESPSISATAGALPTSQTLSVTVNADIASKIVLTSGNSQIGTVANALTNPFVSTVEDLYGNPVSGTSVTFSIATVPSGATGQVLSVTSTSTNASGQASSTLTLGNLIGAYTVEAASSGLTGSPVTFTATGNADNAANLALVSGDGQTASVNTALSNGFIVRVTDQHGNIVVGESVTFAINSTPNGATGQSLSVTTTSTDSSGLATSVLTLGNLIGTYTTTAVSGTLIGSPVVFTATATSSVPDGIALVSGNLQSGVVGTALANPFVVLVTDASGNPASGQSVTFAINGTPSGATGQVLSVTSTSTNASGQASSTLTLGNFIGTYTVTATAPGLTGSPITFTATGTADNATTITLVSGDGQNALINTALSNPFVVVVTDQYGNPVNSEVVVFAINSTPSGATGQSLSQTTVATNTVGQSSSVLTLGNLIGAYTVTATSGSLTGSPVTFNATATLGGINASTSTVVASPTSVAADGAATSTITVTLRDAGSNPISGLAVSLTSSRGSVDDITINGVTDSSGQITGTVRSITSGIATIVAVGDPAGQNVTIAQTAQVTFTAISQDFVVQIDPFYDAANDAIVITTLLLENGVLNTDIANMTLEVISVSDDTGTSLSGNLNGPGDTVTDALNAIFHTVWDPSAGLTADVVYTIIAKIKYENITYSGIKAFSVDQLGSVKDSITNLNAKADTLQGTATDASTEVDSIESNVDALDVKVGGFETTQADYRTATLKTLSSLTTNVGSILEDTETTIPNLLAAEISAQLAKGIQSEIVTRPRAVVTGATVPVRFRSASRLSPKITVYDPNDVARINSVVMTEVGKTGIYEYKVTFNTDWGTGDFMVLVQESVKKSVDSLVFNVESASASTTTGTTGVPAAGSSSAVTIDTLYSRITSIDSEMDSLISDIDSVKDNTSGVDDDITELIRKVGSGNISNTMSKADIQQLVSRLNSVSESIGVVDGDANYQTVLGKLRIIEETLIKVGVDGSIGLAFNQNARQKAGNITEFIGLITTELEEKGTVENLEGKMEILEGYLMELKGAVSEIPVSMTADNVTNSVEETLKELSTLAAGNEGLGELMRLVEGGMAHEFSGGMSADEMLEMRNDVNALKSLMVEIRGLLDSEVNKPVVHGWLEGN